MKFDISNGTSFDWDGKSLEVPKGLIFESVLPIRTVKILHELYSNGIKNGWEAAGDENTDVSIACYNICKTLESFNEAYEDYLTLNESIDAAYEKAERYGGLKVRARLLPEQFTVYELSSNYLDEAKLDKAYIESNNTEEFIEMMEDDEFRSFISTLASMYNKMSDVAAENDDGSSVDSDEDPDLSWLDPSGDLQDSYNKVFKRG